MARHRHVALTILVADILHRMQYYERWCSVNILDLSPQDIAV
jgi:hypothetical protein